MSNILVVEDNSIMCMQIASYLKEHNHIVKEANDGLAALDLISKERFDIIIADLKMPGVDGIEVLKKAKSEDSTTIVIIITAFGNVEEAVEAMKLGAEDFIKKPFSIDELVVKIGKILENRELQQEHLRLLEENKALREEIGIRYGFENIVGESLVMQDVFKRFFSQLVNRK